MNNGKMMAQLLKQEIYCESGKLKHLLNDKKLENFIKELESSKPSLNKDFTVQSVSPKSAHNFYYECPDCGYVTEEEPTKDKDTTRHNCSPTS